MDIWVEAMNRSTFWHSVDFIRKQRIFPATRNFLNSWFASNPSLYWEKHRLLESEGVLETILPVSNLVQESPS